MRHRHVLKLYEKANYTHTSLAAHISNANAASVRTSLSTHLGIHLITTITLPRDPPTNDLSSACNTDTEIHLVPPRPAGQHRGLPSRRGPKYGTVRTIGSQYKHANSTRAPLNNAAQGLEVPITSNPAADLPIVSQSHTACTKECPCLMLQFTVCVLFQLECSQLHVSAASHNVTSRLQRCTYPLPATRLILLYTPLHLLANGVRDGAMATRSSNGYQQSSARHVWQPY